MDFTGITQIAVIINSHGLKGELKISPLTDDPEIFQQDTLIILNNDNQPQAYSVIKARPFKKYFWLIQFNEIQDIDTARNMKGKGIYLEDEKLRPLEEDEFFIHDLIKAEVYSTDNQYLGIITNYFEAGTQGVCEVNYNKEKFLFPVTNEVLKEIIPAEEVIINLLPELRDLNI